MRLLLASTVTLAAAAALAARRSPPLPEGGATEATLFDILPDPYAGEPDQLTTPFEDLAVTLNPSTYAPAGVPADTADANVRAFLDMIARAEGTAHLGDRGYNVLFGGRTFGSYADHLRPAVDGRRGLRGDPGGPARGVDQVLDVGAPHGPARRAAGMKLDELIPTPIEIGREAITVLAGALLAALIVSQLPSVKAWIKQAWN
jgi:hypothetical protein